MAKYHIKDDGEPGVCKAQPGKCPKAKDSEHYTTREDARAAFEKKMESELNSRFEKFPNPSPADEEFKAKVARRRRVEDAVLKADPRRTVIQASPGEIPRSWGEGIEHGYFIHPDFRKALPDDEDMAAYVEIVQLEDSLSDYEKASAFVSYNSKSGLFVYTYRKDRAETAEDYY